MKKWLLLLLLSAGMSFGSAARSFPPEWARYLTEEYLAEVQTGRNERNLPEREFLDELLNGCRTNLARQVQVRVSDFAELEKRARDGAATVVYSSRTQFSTDVDLRLVVTRTYYDPETGEGCALACIGKEEARRYYRSEIDAFLERVDHTLALVCDYVGAGFKGRAKSELEALLPRFGMQDEAFLWLRIFGFPSDEYAALSSSRNEREHSVKRMLADLQHATTICLICSAELFGTPHAALSQELKGRLSAEGCSFTDDPARADWVVRVEVSAREYNRLAMEARTLYFSYVDASVSIDKAVASQRICEEGLSVKGGHTISYEEAARAACRELVGRIGELVVKTLQQ